MERYIKNFGREKMITTETAPTLNVSAETFGKAALKLVIETHLYKLAAAMGVTATPESIDLIEDDIISGYGYLKITEIILALKMMREGKFREGHGGGGNRASMYGVLSSDAVCDCINRFDIEHRRPVLDAYEHQKKLEENIKLKMSGPFNYTGLVEAVIANPSSFKFVKTYLTQEEIKMAEKAVSEFEALRLLKKRVEQHLTEPTDKTLEALKKGIEYINSNFSDNDN